MFIPFVNGPTVVRQDPDQGATLDQFIDRACTELSSLQPQAITLEAQGMRTGAAFVEAVRSIALPTEIRHAEQRYGLCLEALKKKSTLTPLEILAFATQIVDVHQDTLDSLERGIQANEGSKEWLVVKHLYHTAALRQRISACLKALPDLTGVSIQKRENGLRSYLVKDLARLSVEDKTLSIDQFNEILAKKLVSGHLKEGMQLPLPTFIHPETGQIQTHRGHFIVQKVITKKGLKAVALVPQGAPDFIKPTLVFRPTTLDVATQENGLQTMMDDMCRHVGKRSFEAARSELGQLLEDETFLPQGQKAHLCGFSLGGAHAARMLAAHPDRFSKAVFFNDPSTEPAVHTEFCKNLRSSSHEPSAPLEINIYHTRHDPVSLAGEVHVGFFAREDRLQDRCRVTRAQLVDENQVGRVGLLARKNLHTNILLSGRRVVVDKSASSLEGRVSVTEASTSLSTRSLTTRVRVLPQVTLNRQTSPDAIKANGWRCCVLGMIIRNLAYAILGLCWSAGMAGTYVAKGLKATLYAVSDDHDEEFLQRASEVYNRVCLDMSHFLGTPRVNLEQLAKLQQQQPYAFVYDLT